MALAKPCHGGLTLDPTQWGQHLGQGDGTVATRYAIGAHPLKQQACILTRDLVLGKAGQIQYAHLLADCAALCRHGGKPVAAPKAVFLGYACRSEPFGALPAERITENGALCFKGVVERRHTGRPACLAELTRQGGLIHLLIFIDRLCHRIITGRPFAVTPGIHVAHVDFGLAMHHPLGKVFTAAGALGDTDRSTTAQPVIAQPLRGPQ